MSLFVLEEDVVGPEVSVVEHIELFRVLLVTLCRLGYHLWSEGLKLIRNARVQSQILRFISELPDYVSKVLEVGSVAGVEGSPGVRLKGLCVLQW